MASQQGNLFCLARGVSGKRTGGSGGEDGREVLFDANVFPFSLSLFHFSAQDLNAGETPVRAPVQRVQRVSAGLAHELKFSWPSKEVVWQ